MFLYVLLTIGMVVTVVESGQRGKIFGPESIARPPGMKSLI